MAVLTLTTLNRFPVKSLRGESFRALEIGPRGFVFDRRWMVVNAEGRFLTQRQQPRMALIDTSIGEDGTLRLAAQGAGAIRVADDELGRIPVTVWGDTVNAALVDPAADAWLSDFLSLPCRLVRFADELTRPVDPTYALPSDHTAFADGFPFLLISQGSLDDLNARLETPVPMIRFRPNLVVQGCAPFAEDDWKRIRIGTVTFRVAKPCSRCAIPTVDPATGQRGSEPLRTLAGYRRRDNQVFFGQNLLHDGPGRLEVGMKVEVLE